MSDIKMTEVERFNKALNSAFDRLEMEGHSDCSSELFSASNAILTTIESQKEEIEKLQAIIHESVLAGFREQVDKAKVDTGTLKEIREELRKAANYKAITELAVKRMQDLSTHVGDILANDFYFEAYAELKKKAFEYASEIERLSHA